MVQLLLEGIQFWWCDICDNIFTEMAAMDTHMKKIHAKCVDYEDDYQAEQKDEQHNSEKIVNSNNSEDVNDGRCDETRREEFDKTAKINGSSFDDDPEPAETEKDDEEQVENNDYVKEKVGEGYYCVVCNFEYEQKHTLRCHILSHFYNKFYPLIPKEKPFSCPDCGKISRDRITLIRHYCWQHDYFEKITGLSKDVIELRKMSVPNSDRKNSDVHQREQVIQDKQISGDQILSESKRKRGRPKGTTKNKITRTEIDEDVVVTDSDDDGEEDNEDDPDFVVDSDDDLDSVFSMVI